MEDVPEEWGEGGKEGNCEGEEKECGRCGSGFVVPRGGVEGLEGGNGKKCSFHWGRKVSLVDYNLIDVFVGYQLNSPPFFVFDPAAMGKTTRFVAVSPLLLLSSPSSSSFHPLSQTPSFLLLTHPGVRTQLATCCLSPFTSPGCTSSLSHVFKETSPSDLHRRVGFKTTEQVREELMKGEMGGIGMGGGLEVGAMDCEMFVSVDNGKKGRKEGEESKEIDATWVWISLAVLDVWDVGGEGDVVG